MRVHRHPSHQILSRYVDEELTEAQAARMVRQVRTEMNEIEGDLPRVYDIRTAGLWAELVERTLQGLAALIGQGKYLETTPELVRGLGGWARADETVAIDLITTSSPNSIVLTSAVSTRGATAAEIGIISLGK